MRNPLRHRIGREFKNEFGKYLAVILFLMLTIGFVSGALVAGGSMLKTYEESFEKYNIEDGNFELSHKAGAELTSRLEKENLTIYPNFYKEKSSGRDRTLRIFVNRSKVNKVCLMKGSFLEEKDEIALDRMYAENNKIKIGDTIKVGGRKVKVTGLVALPDYSALFSDNGDSMFDAMKFGVAVVTKEGFQQWSGKIHYSYSWVYDRSPKGDTQKKERSDEILEVLASNAVLENYVPEYANQAIHFTGDDMGGDRILYIVLLYILILIIAFMFAVTTNHTISKEANVIGTLRASGYTRGEIVRHYMTLPTLITIFSAVLGNLVGYTIFKDIIANLYYGSYSLTTYHTIWNGEAFLLTTVIPFLIVLGVNYLTIRRKMSLLPIYFLRRDLSRHHQRKTMKLPNFKFFTRFRIRIFLQNLPGYGTLFLGICFANLLLLFGMMMTPLLDHYKEEILKYQIADYQYILKAPVKTQNKTAEQYAVTSLSTTFSNFEPEDISVYGVKEESRYIKDAPLKNEIEISDGFSKKYGLKKGDTVILKELYKNKTYRFKITGVRHYPAALTVFMNINKFRQTFHQEKSYYNGWFSKSKLKDLDEQVIQTTITRDSLTKTTRQLELSMGSIFYLFHGVSGALYVILFFVLAKVVLEKNTNSISMIKILGYENREIRRLYLRATAAAVVISMLVTIPLSYYLMKAIYVPMMQKAFTGWLPYYVKPTIYPQMFLYGVVIYFIVEAVLYRKIKKIPMDEALKTVE